MKAIFIFLLIIVLCSCRKDYSCQCYTTQGHEVSKNIEISGRKKSDAEKLCKAYNDETQDCSIQ
jgi:hypothetical protein